MKKIVAAIATGFIITGAAAINVSAEDYEVQQGDNLWDIADEYNTSVEELVDINELKSTVIHPKQTLFINETYVVQKDDTLIGIGNEYDVTADELIEWNNLSSSVIAIGQELEIKGVNVAQEDNPAPKAAKKASAEEEQNTQNTATANESNKKEAETAAKAEQEQTAEGKTVSVTATAYTAGCAGCSGITSTGIDLNANPNAKVIAVDPNVIPLGSEVYVEGYGYAVAGDIGSAIKGNKIDIHVPTKDDAYSWGVKTVDVTIVE